MNVVPQDLETENFKVTSQRLPQAGLRDEQQDKGPRVSDTNSHCHPIVSFEVQMFLSGIPLPQ